jgi:hypothetical protein
MRDVSLYREAWDEIPLGGSLKNGGELSMCPFCFTSLVPGHGLHFRYKTVWDSFERKNTWQVTWIRNRRYLDLREARNYLSYIRRTIAEIVEESDILGDPFWKLWIDRYQKSILKWIPINYMWVHQSFCLS